ncbi:MAG: nuclear transport factor 2 family protein [Saprospiraceae bacterium]|nr:nuclear transport factor 2 family protein [Saprospiraceae bacterium]
MTQFILRISISLFFAGISGGNLFAQAAEHDAVKQKIDSFFLAMTNADSAWMNSNLLPETILTTVKGDESKNMSITKQEFIQSLLKSKDAKVKIDERLLNYSIRVDQNFAIVTTDYRLYVNDKFIHCGVNLFTLVKTTDSWKIMNISDTRRKENCNENPVADINKFMDDWHLAAARADADKFFGSMTEDGIYIGTDKTERWFRDEIREWSKKYFERKSAWDFKPLERQVHLSEDGQYAWFNETLDTWMGICRGSGILVKSADSWLIKQYHLSVTIDNDKIDGFLKVIGKKE